MRPILILFLAVTATAAVRAESLAQYLKLRKQLGISQATTSLALDTLVGSGTMEVLGVVRGTVTVDGVSSMFLEVPGAEPLVVKAKAVPAWLLVPQAQARLLIKATRTNEFSQLKADLLAATEEGPMAKWEAGERAKAEASAKARVRTKDGKRDIIPLSSRGGAARKPGEWNVSAYEAVPVYANFIQGYNPRLTAAKAKEIAQGIIGFSVEFGVDARLITAMVLVESGFNPSATSRAGAMGLGQLMPGTARGMGVRNAYDTFENLWGTVRLIRGHLEKYSTSGRNGEKYQDLVLALAAYNAGGGAVRKYGGVPPYRETKNYIKKVTDWYGRLSGR